MIAITHLRRPGADVEQRAATALQALAACAGYERGTLGRAVDDPEVWVLVTEWSNVGSYRRALGNYQVKLHATPLLAEAADVPGAFEALIDVAPGGAAVAHSSDLAP